VTCSCTYVFVLSGTLFALTVGMCKCYFVAVIV